MSSLEIADLVESRHDNVKVTIERLAERGVITLPAMQEASFLNAIGRTQRVNVYAVSKRDSYVVEAQLSPEFTARLVKRWEQLEQNAITHAPALTQEQMLAQAYVYAIEKGAQQEIRLSRLTRESFTIIQ